MPANRELNSTSRRDVGMAAVVHVVGLDRGKDASPRYRHLCDNRLNEGLDIVVEPSLFLDYVHGTETVKDGEKLCPKCKIINPVGPCTCAACSPRDG